MGWYQTRVVPRDPVPIYPKLMCTQGSTGPEHCPTLMDAVMYVLVCIVAKCMWRGQVHVAWPSVYCGQVHVGWPSDMGARPGQWQWRMVVPGCLANTLPCTALCLHDVLWQMSNSSDCVDGRQQRPGKHGPLAVQQRHRRTQHSTACRGVLRQACLPSCLPATSP